MNVSVSNRPPDQKPEEKATAAAARLAMINGLVDAESPQRDSHHQLGVVQYQLGPVGESCVTVGIGLMADAKRYEISITTQSQTIQVFVALDGEILGSRPFTTDPVTNAPTVGTLKPYDPARLDGLLRTAKERGQFSPDRVSQG
jgi:hypothetical protein